MHLLVFALLTHFATIFYHVSRAIKNGGRPPLTYQSFVALAGKPPDPLAKTYSELPPVGNVGKVELLNVPTIEELGYKDIEQVFSFQHYWLITIETWTYVVGCFCRRNFHHLEVVNQKLFED